jgi:HEAT repeat protein
MKLDAERLELENMLISSDASVVFFAVRNLRKFSPDKVTTALISFLRNPERTHLRKHRIEAVKILAEAHDSINIVRILDLLTSERDSHVLATLISSCSEFMSENSDFLPLLTPLLQHDDARVAANAIEAMGKFGPDIVRGNLKSYLFSSIPRQSMNAATAFYKAGEEKIYSFVRLKLTGEDPCWQASAAHAIGKINSSDSVTDLLKILPTSLPQVRETVLKGLAGTANQASIMPIISCMLIEKEINLQHAYIHTLKAIGEEQTVAKLSEISANSGNPRIQATAVKLLGHFDVPGTLDTVKRGLMSNDPRVMANSIEALMNQGNEASSIMLNDYLTSAHPRVRGNAVMAMWKLGITGVIKHLREMMDEGDSRNHQSAAWVIEKLGIDYLFSAA